MTHELLYQPSFAVVRIQLGLGEAIRAESGAMVSMSATIEIESGMTGGIGKALGRLLGGESAFQTTFKATRGPGEVLLAPNVIGDVLSLNLAGRPLMVTSGSFLAGSTELTMETQMSGRGFFTGEGLFLLRVSGNGLLLLSSFGAIHRVDLAHGQPYVVDTGHIVAFEEGMGYEVRRAARGLLGSMTSGEGIVAQFTGPGTVYLQTRSPQEFAQFLAKMLPARS